MKCNLCSWDNELRFWDPFVLLFIYKVTWVASRLFVATDTSEASKQQEIQVFLHSYLRFSDQIFLSYFCASALNVQQQGMWFCCGMFITEVLGVLGFSADPQHMQAMTASHQDLRLYHLK